ncbi:MAG: hypothetical protein ACWA41_08840 [Putridiphycobacter sp.]
MPFNKLDHTAIGKIKPRFRLETPELKEDVMNLIINEAKQDQSVVMSSFTRFIKLSCPTAELHYWSPVMNISFEWDEYDKKTYMRGVIGPNEKVWTMLMFFYIGLIVIGMFGGIYSLTKWQISNDPSLLWIAPVCLFLFGSIITVARVGKRKAHLQMLHLLRFLRRAVDSIECVRTDED